MANNNVFPLPDIKTTALLSIALYNTVETFIIIFSTFKSFRGCYFWSFLVSTVGILIYVIGLMLRVFVISPDHRKLPSFVTVLLVGWIFMVTGQAMVLWSRLHYLVKNVSTVRMILAMIIVNGTIGHIPIIALIYGVESGNPTVYIVPLLFYEKVQVTIFFIQSIFIYGLYIFHSTKLLREDAGVHTPAYITLFRRLILINTLLILLDLSILATEWSGHHELSIVYKPVAYSVKLKLEYNIFNALDTEIVLDRTVLSVEEMSMHRRSTAGHPFTTNLGAFYGRTNIIDCDGIERCDKFVEENHGMCQIAKLANVAYPAGEALRSHLSDAPALIPTEVSSVQRWADNVSEDDDLDSFYARSGRATTTDVRLAREILVGLSPAPRSRLGSV